MADFDWKKLVGALAPTLGTALGGPLVGSAISVLSNVLLGKPEGSQDDVSTAVLQGAVAGRDRETARGRQRLQGAHARDGHRPGEG
jgi:hypothetical protein